MISLRVALAGTPLFLVAASMTGGCGPKMAAERSQALIEQTTIGKNRCQSDGDEHKLFIVEWDATDLSTFEAKAERDVVFVHYEGCQMKVLHGCSDGGIAGRYGSYRAPVFTSGAVEGFSIKSEDDLYAKLPLGAVTLGGAVKAGKALELKYFVSGAATSTRDDIYRDDLKDNPRCEKATHFVWNYSLGAFNLSAADSLKASAEVGYGKLSGGGSHDEQSSVLRHGGDIGTCSSVAQHSCRVPIRVTLRAIQNGAKASAGGAGGAAPPPAPAATDGAMNAAMGMMTGVQLRQSAEQKEMSGDGAGCLADLDRADRGDRQGANAQSEMVRAKCEMRAGKCAEGKKRFRAAMASWTRQNDRSGLSNDATLDAQAEQMAKSKCPAPGAGGVSNETNVLTIMQKVMQAAAAKDVPGCISSGNALEKAMNVPGAADQPALKMGGVGGMRQAAMCAADGGKCAEAKGFWRVHTKLLTGQGAADADASFAINVPACKGK